MRTTVLTIGVVLVVALGALFAVQNSARTTELSLDLGVAAWRLADPVSVPMLIGASFGLGLLLGMAVVVMRAMRLASRIRQLEQQVTVQSLAAGGSQGRDTGASRDLGSW